MRLSWKLPRERKKLTPFSDTFSRYKYSYRAVRYKVLYREGGYTDINSLPNGECQVCALLPKVKSSVQAQYCAGVCSSSMPCGYELHTPLPEKNILVSQTAGHCPALCPTTQMIPTKLCTTYTITLRSTGHPSDKPQLQCATDPQPQAWRLGLDISRAVPHHYLSTARAQSTLSLSDISRFFKSTVHTGSIQAIGAFSQRHGP